MARPLARGEDPGQLSVFSDPGGMILTLLTLVGCAGWAAWRLWAGQPGLYLGATEIGLVLLTLAVFVGASHASYLRAAWLAGWEWIGLCLLVLLVRQLAVRPEERHGLFAVVLASLVALAAQGVYQAAYELPRTARLARNGTTQFLEEELGAQAVAPSQRDAMQLELYQMAQRLDHRRTHGPYFHPSSFAAVLTLALPLLLGALTACLRGGSPTWQTVLVAFCFLLVVGVLFQTGSWLAVAISLLLALVVLALAWPSTTRGRVVGLVVAGLIGAASLAGFTVGGLLTEPFARWAEVCPAAWRLIVDHFWFGVGPAQFGTFYPRYQSATAGPRYPDAPNALLQVWADGGILAAGALLAVVVLFTWAIWRWWQSSAETPPREEQPTSPALPVDAPLRWEYYLGGMLGLILAFVLRAGSLPTDADILGEALVAGVRSLVWFAAFALFEGIGWTEGEHVGALAAGAAGMFVFLLFEAGIGYPSVAVLLWVAVVLALATVTPAPAPWLSRQNALSFLPVPMFLAGAFVFFAFVFYPTASSSSTMRRAQVAGMNFYLDTRRPREERTLRDPVAYIRQSIIDPLEVANREDTDNMRLQVQLAHWYTEMWALDPGGNRKLAPEVLALQRAARAIEVNPQGRDGPVTMFDVHVRVATVYTRAAEMMEKPLDKKKPGQMSEEQRKQQAGQHRRNRQVAYERAAEAIERYLNRDPTDPVLRARLGLALFEAGRTNAAREQARRALALDEEVGPTRHLSEQTRRQLEDRLRKESAR